MDWLNNRAGYSHVSAVFSQTEVDYFRSQTIATLQNGMTAPLTPMYCKDVDFILDYAFSGRIVEALRKKFHPSYVMFPDLEVQYNLYGAGKSSSVFSGWHVDSNSEGAKEYLLRKGYGFAKVGVYFQDNSAVNGGGVDVAPGSHRFPKLGGLSTRFFLKKVINIIQIVVSSKSVLTQAGDILIFDSRLQHRSSRFRGRGYAQTGSIVSYDSEYVNLPTEMSKIVLYFDVAFPESALEFWLNAKRRSSSDHPSEQAHFSYAKDFVDFSKFKDRAFKAGVATIFDIVGGY